MPPEGSPSPPRRVAILGLGVMGGSLARSLSRLDPRPQLCGWSPDGDEGKSARAEGVLDRVASTPEDAVIDSDMTVLAAPLSACIDLTPRVLASMPGDAVLTDLASLKIDMEVAVTRAGALERWVGCHPMCGSAASGWAASRDGLFRGAPVWLVAHPAARDALGAVEALWTAVGAHTMRTTAPEHDALMALVSHLPQLTANALAAVLDDAGVRATSLGPGGRDMTRLAESAPAMWGDLLERAAPALPGALRALGRRCGELADLVEGRRHDELAAWMERTRAWRRPS